VVSRPNAPFV